MVAATHTIAIFGGLSGVWLTQRHDTRGRTQRHGATRERNEPIDRPVATRAEREEVGNRQTLPAAQRATEANRDDRQADRTRRRGRERPPRSGPRDGGG